MRHCPDCRHPYAPSRDVCPECWSPLESGPPPARQPLTLVFETDAFFEADLLEAALLQEGIPSLRTAGRGALPMALGIPAMHGVRLYVRTDASTAAFEIVDEVFPAHEGRGGRR